MGWKPGSSPSWACSPSTWWGGWAEDTGPGALGPAPPREADRGVRRALAGWGNLRHQVQEGVTGERAHSHAQEGLDDVVGGGATSGTAEEHEPEEGAQADQQRGQGAVQVPWTGRTVSASLPTVAPRSPGRGVQVESGRSRIPPRLQAVGCSPGLKPPSSFPLQYPVLCCPSIPLPGLPALAPALCSPAATFSSLFGSSSMLPTPCALPRRCS